MDQGRSGDLVLPQGTYVLLQDGASGEVKVVVGPSKVSMADTDKPVVYEMSSRRYAPNSADKAIKVCPSADEGQYIVLTNPVGEKEPKEHPPRGKQDNPVVLETGRRINLQGPKTFALWPGQVADVVDGHQLKSNEYLIIRVYEEEVARANLSDAVVKTATGEVDENATKKSKKATPTSLFDEKEIRTGNLLIIKGTGVSFYIPPTGIEVLEDGNGNYTRNAVTLERLEYCILLDQNGDKRYVKGPAVVFPKPTESFIENKGKKVFKAIELNENMALYIKVIADYDDDPLADRNSDAPRPYDHLSGDELFITGKNQKIYFPRPEHAIIKYSDDMIHYATAVPAGEGRYILNKDTGAIETQKGPKMLLPDPRNQVIVKRVLDTKTVALWYPGNQEAIDHNFELGEAAIDTGLDYYADVQTRSGGIKSMKTTMLASSVAGPMAEEMKRLSTYTKPRTIQLDTKYDGAVLLNVWPNFAVQVVNRVGDRRIVEGPKIVMLDYDETLDVLEFSTGKPKHDHELMKTVYLQTKNNVVSDIITVETKDLIEVNIRISYKVDFEGDPTKWFSVSDYVKLLTQHMRSVIRNSVKKLNIEEFYESAADIIRDVILGENDKKTGKRVGREFEENNMKIYDVEVLNMEIGDNKISNMIINNQHDIVKKNLEGIAMQKDAEFSKKEEGFKREKIAEDLKTETALNNARKEKLDNKKLLDDTELASEMGKQDSLDELSKRRNLREEDKIKIKLDEQKELSGIRMKEIKSQMDSVAPGLIEAMIASNGVEVTRILAENLTAQRDSASGLASLFGGGVSSGLEGMLATVKGTPLEGKLQGIIDKVNEMQEKRSK